MPPERVRRLLHRLFPGSKINIEESSGRRTIVNVALFGGKVGYQDGLQSNLTSREGVKILKEEKEDFFKAKELEFVRADHLAAISDLDYAFENREAMLKELKKYLDAKDRYALEWSLIVESAMRRKELDLAIQRREDIKKAFGERGNRLCNLLCTGYFDTVIYPELLDIVKKNRNDEDGVRQTFREYLDQRLERFPNAIFVSFEKTIAQIVRDVEAGLFDHGLTGIDIHGIGRENIHKAQEAAKIIIQRYPELMVISLSRKIGEARAVFIAISKDHAKN